MSARSSQFNAYEAHHTTSADVGAYTYGLGHPMKPHRIQVTHELVTAYDMLDKMQVLVSSGRLNISGGRKPDPESSGQHEHPLNP